MQCSNCHINPTGGGLGNWLERLADFINDHLRLVKAVGDSTDFNFNPQLNDYILLGGDVRFQYLYDGSQKKTTFQSMEGSIYSSFRLFTSTDLLVKYDFANNAYEAYGLYKFNSDNSYVKVGAFEPSYGIRLDDHTAYTRGGNFRNATARRPSGYSLIFSPDYWDAGIKVGSQFDNLFVTVDATNGAGLAPLNFRYRKAFVGKAEYLMKGNFMIGASRVYCRPFSYIQYPASCAGIGQRLTIWANGIGRIHFPGLASDTTYINAKSNAALVEVTYFVTNGLSATGRFDYFRTVWQPDLREVCHRGRHLSRNLPRHFMPQVPVQYYHMFVQKQILNLQASFLIFFPDHSLVLMFLQPFYL